MCDPCNTSRETLADGGSLCTAEPPLAAVRTAFADDLTPAPTLLSLWDQTGRGTAIFGWRACNQRGSVTLECDTKLQKEVNHASHHHYDYRVWPCRVRVQPARRGCQSEGWHRHRVSVARQRRHVVERRRGACGWRHPRHHPRKDRRVSNRRSEQPRHGLLTAANRGSPSPRRPRGEGLAPRLARLKRARGPGKPPQTVPLRVERFRPDPASAVASRRTVQTLCRLSCNRSRRLR